MASPCAPLIPVVPMTSGIRRRAAPESSMFRFSGAEKSSAASSPLSASRLSQPPRPTWPITRTSSRRAQTASSVRPILPLPTMAIFKGLHLRLSRFLTAYADRNAAFLCPFTSDFMPFPCP